MSNIKMTAKTAVAILKGERERFNAMATLRRYDEGRIARAGGIANTNAQDIATQRVNDAYDYAIAALLLVKQSGKSAIKEAERQGLTTEST